MDYATAVAGLSEALGGPIATDTEVEHVRDRMNFHNLPCAAHGLTSYRIKGPFGFIMIGATDVEDAMREAARSTAHPKREALEIWNGDAYIPA